MLASKSPKAAPDRPQLSTLPIFSMIIKGRNMIWAILVLAGLFEMGWAIGLKYTDGFARLWPTVWTILAMIVSLWLLGIVMKTLPVGTAYSVWVGVGAVGTVILGIVLFGEPVNAGRLISVAFIIAGIVGLKLTTPV
jgi:quaternary ammonium compound-resistance protein SugE